MDKLQKLIDGLHKRVDGFKQAAKKCSTAEDRFVLQVRADEVERCIIKIEKAVAKDGQEAEATR